MRTRSARLAAALLAIIAWAVFSGRPSAAPQANARPAGTYQIASFPGRPPQFAADMPGHTGCYLVDTTSGELWVLSIDPQQRGSWKKVADPLR